MLWLWQNDQVQNSIGKLAVKAINSKNVICTHIEHTYAPHRHAYTHT